MTDDEWEEPDSLRFVAANFRWVCSEEEGPETGALQIISDKGISVLIEFPGGGARALRECVRRAFETYPEMETWKSAKPH